VQFVRVDADVVDNLIDKQENIDSVLSKDEVEQAKKLFEFQVPEITLIVEVKGLSKDAAKKFLSQSERGKLEDTIKKDNEIRKLKEDIETMKKSDSVQKEFKKNLDSQLNKALIAQNTSEVRELIKKINPKLEEFIKKVEENKQNKGEPPKPKEVPQSEWDALRNKAKAIKLNDTELGTKVKKLADEYHAKYTNIGFKTVNKLVQAMNNKGNTQENQSGGKTLRNYFRNNRATRRRF
jgi:hypothetical protein